MLVDLSFAPHYFLIVCLKKTINVDQNFRSFNACFIDEQTRKNDKVQHLKVFTLERERQTQRHPDGNPAKAQSNDLNMYQKKLGLLNLIIIWRRFHALKRKDFP